MLPKQHDPQRSKEETQTSNLKLKGKLLYTKK